MPDFSDTAFMRIKPLLLLLLCCSHWAMALPPRAQMPDLSTIVENDPEWPLDLIPIAKLEYPRNRDASFCYRPVEMIDTIVIHHSETTPQTTALQINDIHLNRGTAENPWYMIAYSYVINSPYIGAKTPEPLLTEGRPLTLVGAHAGSKVFVPMDEEQKRMWDEGRIVCGKENGEFVVDPAQLQGDKIKANVTTIGVVVNGNYSPFSRSNLGGYSKKDPRYPSKGTQDMIARLSCQLQKKYPRMKYLRWHNFYHSTSCPGTIKNYVGQIRAKAKEYGCEFN
jgi:hypothetical protein